MCQNSMLSCEKSAILEYEKSQITTLLFDFQFRWDTRTRTKNDRTRICSVTITPYPNTFALFYNCKCKGNNFFAKCKNYDCFFYFTPFRCMFASLSFLKSAYIFAFLLRFDKLSYCYLNATNM